MRKKLIFATVFILIIIIIGGSLNANGIFVFNSPMPKPQEGVFYCKELNISIDFSMVRQGEARSATLYSNDGLCEVLSCYFDYGNGMDLYSDEKQEWILFATYKYQKFESEDLLLVTRNDDGAQFEFVRVDESKLPNTVFA